MKINLPPTQAKASHPEADSFLCYVCAHMCLSLPCAEYVCVLWVVRSGQPFKASISALCPPSAPSLMLSFLTILLWSD
jgi:hypothetical protein